MCEATVSLRSSLLSSKGEETSLGAEDVCWICHEGHSEALPLASPCRCKAMLAHRGCVARWQLQQAGTREERQCRFCSTELPDWREAHASYPKATPIMSVVHQGVTHQVRVQPGPEGRDDFQRAIRAIFNLSENDAISLTFGCKVPGSAVAAHEVTLEGWQAFDAAVHCAAISAGQRVANSQRVAEVTPQRRATSGGAPKILRRLFSRGHQG